MTILLYYNTLNQKGRWVLIVNGVKELANEVECSAPFKTARSGERYCLEIEASSIERKAGGLVVIS